MDNMASSVDYSTLDLFSSREPISITLTGTQKLALKMSVSNEKWRTIKRK